MNRIAFYVLVILSFFLAIPVSAQASSIFFSDNFDDPDGTYLSIHNPGTWSYVNQEPWLPNRWGEYQIHNNRATDGTGIVFSWAKLNLTLPEKFTVTTNFFFHPGIWIDHVNQHYIDIRLNNSSNQSMLFRFWLLANGLRLSVHEAADFTSAIGDYNTSGLNTISVTRDQNGFIATINGEQTLSFSNTTFIPNYLIISQPVNTSQLENLVIDDNSPTLQIDCIMSEWSTCSAQCGGGTQTREILQNAENGGIACGETSRSCNEDPCVPQITSFSQRDPQWKNKLYDSANVWSPNSSSIEKWGCALTAASTVLDYHGIKQLPGGQTNNPDNLNTWLKAQPDGYIRSGAVNWNAVSRATKLVSTEAQPALEYLRKGNDAGDLHNRLNSQQPVILEEPGHFITAYEHDQPTNTTKIVDPYWTTGPSAKTTLGSYGNSFVSMRTFTPSHTNLGYIMSVSDQNVIQNLFKVDGQNLIPTQESYLQSPIIGPESTDASGTPFSILEYAKPELGEYKLKLKRDAPGYANTEIYSYDADGNPTTTTLSSLFGSEPITVNISYNNGVATMTKSADFMTLRQDILAGRNMKYFRLGYNGADMLSLVDSASLYYRSNRMVSRTLISTFARLLQYQRWLMNPKLYDSINSDLKLVLQQQY